jgi:hypothetical protein
MQTKHTFKTIREKVKDPVLSLIILLTYLPMGTQNSAERLLSRLLRISESKPRSAPKLLPLKRVPNSLDATELALKLATTPNITNGSDLAFTG